MNSLTREEFNVHQQRVLNRMNEMRENPEKIAKFDRIAEGVRSWAERKAHLENYRATLLDTPTPFLEKIKGVFFSILSFLSCGFFHFESGRQAQHRIFTEAAAYVDELQQQVQSEVGGFAQGENGEFVAYLNKYSKQNFGERSLFEGVLKVPSLSPEMIQAYTATFGAQ